MRDVEKTQTKPNVAMLESLFQIDEQKKKPLILEKKVMEEKGNIRFAASKADRQEKENGNNGV